MKTKTLISRISRVFPSVPRAVILEQINVALRIIIDRPLAFMRIIDESTGKNPVLSTVPGQFAYEANVATLGYDAKYVARIFTGEENDSASYNTVGFSTRVALGTGNAKIILSEDPVASTYYVEAYSGVTELLTEVFPVHIPFPDEYVDSYLYKLITGLFEDEFHGKSVKLEEFYARDISVLRGELNTSMQSNVMFTTERYY